ncbi:unnamed protein product [Macrosiphum euphorbiae]|uniref:Uncharacterized protein n=1 Tax=Macrosiphum euphorbiae TaxID=13131 RepID=A0AAV0VZM2_9HEMI|nr:unnamed protein product [Macrosiphum euphorbiae]
MTTLRRYSSTPHWLPSEIRAAVVSSTCDRTRHGPFPDSSAEPHFWIVQPAYQTALPVPNTHRGRDSAVDLDNEKRDGGGETIGWYSLCAHTVPPLAAAYYVIQQWRPFDEPPPTVPLLYNIIKI